MGFSSGVVPLALVDLAQVSTVSHKGTLGLLPPGKKGRQKFVVGDDSGTVHCFEMKRGEAQTVFSFRFADSYESSGSGSAGTGSMITAVVMGGTTGGSGGGDRIFATQGSSIVGLSRKGKDFFKMASPLSETIHHMAVQNDRIWTGCDYICSAYDDGKDSAFYMCHDRISSLVAASVSGTDSVDAVLGCQDQCIRVVKASQPEVVLQASTDAPVGALCTFSKSGMGMDQTWELPGGGDVGRGVTALKRYDLTQDGIAELIVGREDGTVTVYRFPESSSVGSCPQEAFSIDLGESIRSLECGKVSNDQYPEVVVCTFRGRVCSLTTQALDQGEAGDASGRTVGDVNDENRVKQLKKEVADLEKRVATEKKRLEAAGGGRDGNESSAAYTPATQHFQAITSCTLDPEQGAYVISVETPVPLDLVLLHAAIHMDFLESDDEDDRGQATSCVTSLSPENGGGVCATYRFESGATRLRLRARTTEGDYGDVRMTVVAKIPPKKSAQVIHFSMKPLSLHHRVHAMPRNLQARPMNALVLRGNFTMQVIHDWLAMCLPDVPPRISAEAEDATLNFENVFTGGILTASYRRGAAVVSSDSASTLAIVKELISKEATSRRVHITDTFQVEVMGALKEISMQEPETPWMFEEYRYTLDNAERIQKEFKGRPRALEYISGIITDLYVDWHKFKGDDARHRIPELEHLLVSQYDYKALVVFFLKHP
ncbi:Bardet-Biedl syndrome protein 7 [Ectocarpus siliculosus]|uniref:Bardet-Biedl syndrome protein 7 n=1 Tax=Ectocarpus siliculosus TaxID=2880 RepID=D8LC08_ECTSI|nr:Bardet-Biedl syndrome protein 7 [Ectocarpus siliculosus]|eukprot:CBN79191.1 Bardet-Biedl syndrome protein 7 [Ectocarpus siliculosus]